MILHGYFRSSAAWRVRIALNLKGLTAEHRYQHLRKGEQRSPEYMAINPQGLLPSLILDEGAVLTQSLAICEYLDEVYPDPPLLPRDPLVRAQIRAFAQVIACDIHPLQNLKVLKALEARGQTPNETQAWAREVIASGFDALETLVAGQSRPLPSESGRRWRTSVWCPRWAMPGGSASNCGGPASPPSRRPASPSPPSQTPTPAGSLTRNSFRPYRAVVVPVRQSAWVDLIDPTRRRGVAR